MHRIRYLIGLLTLAGAVVGAIWIVQLLRSMDQRTGLTLSVEFKNARGLRAGTDVRYRGVTVGTVRSVAITGDGQKAVAQLLIEPTGSEHARVSSTFWIVRPRFAGITAGATGLDTLVRDSYIAFYTPPEQGEPLAANSLIAGSERPPLGSEPETLDDIEHGDLLMTLLVPENHGLEPGSSVIFRGMKTGDVRSVELSPSGTHVEVQLRIARRHRQTVTDKTKFWVARPYVSGALFSGFTVTDVSALLTPYINYHGEPGEGVFVQDGYRTFAESERPEISVPMVPKGALEQATRKVAPIGDDVVLVRITYAAIERDMFSADDKVLRHGTGVLFLDKAGRTVVVTARALVDGSFTERDLWGDPEIADERIKVLLPDGSVLRAGRVWVHPDGGNLAALVLEDARPDLTGTPSHRFVFAEASATEASGSDAVGTVRVAGPDAVSEDQRLVDGAAPAAEWLGGVRIEEGKVVGLLVFMPGASKGEIIGLDRLPDDLRPR